MHRHQTTTGLCQVIPLVIVALSRKGATQVLRLRPKDSYFKQKNIKFSSSTLKNNKSSPHSYAGLWDLCKGSSFGRTLFSVMVSLASPYSGSPSIVCVLAFIFVFLAQRPRKRYAKTSYLSNRSNTHLCRGMSPLLMRRFSRLDRSESEKYRRNILQYSDGAISQAFFCE